MTGKVALVSGAAGGIGTEVARALATAGASVAAMDVRADHLGAAVAVLRAEGLAVQPFVADVTTAQDVHRAVADVEDRCGSIDFLVNAAGVLIPGAVRQLTDSSWATTLAVNSTGVFLVCRAVVDRMVPRGRGAIVTVASNAAGTPRAGMAAYSASKAAATMFTKCLGLEVARYGIRCNVVSPGSTDTDMLRTLWRGTDGARAAIDGDPETFRVGIPLGKLASPSDVAAAVVFLLSEAAGHVTMQDLTVDGGATLGVC
jgi:2,3-dihydro-2,3-dihydroxybenzoate dehydrogenase